MTDPSNALQSFQEELLRGTIQLRRGALDRDLYLHVDNPNGETGFTYVTLKGRTVTALVIFALAPPIQGTLCFGIGYAVPEAYRNQGRAKDAISAAILELQNGFKRHGSTVFYVEAIVGADNKSSQRVAEQVISDAPVFVTDKISGLPALQYVRRIEQPAAS
jgi:hypothetical protein